MSNPEFRFTHTEADEITGLEAEAAAASGAWDEFVDTANQQHAIQDEGKAILKHTRNHHIQERDRKVSGFRETIRQVDGDLSDDEISVPEHIGAEDDAQVKRIDSLIAS